MKKFEEFLDLLLEDGFVARPGHYSLSRQQLQLAYRVWLHCDGENVLPYLDKIYHSSWRCDNNYVLDSEENVTLLEDFLKGDSYFPLSFFSFETLSKVEKYVREVKKNNAHYNSYEERRRRANLDLKRPSFRKKVFAEKGEICQKCGTDKDVSIDHIISVYDGGETTIENSQVLCRQCNRKKGARSERGSDE